MMPARPWFARWRSSVTPCNLAGRTIPVSLTRQTSEFIATVQLADVPATTAHVAKRSILDGLGLAIAGSRSEAARISRVEVESYRAQSRDASVLGAGILVPARFAAFLNALAVHA